MSKFVFVLMPFSDEFTDIYESGIKTVSQSLGLKAERLDEQIYDNDMISQIYKQIDACDFLIADMSGRNPNVFYEVGYADAKKKLIILITKNSEDIPFDLKHRPHVIYEGSIKKLKEELTTRLKWALNEIEQREKKPLKIMLQVIHGEIDRSENIDTAQLLYNLEVTNLSDARVKGLEMIYIHTGPGWTFFLEDRELKQSKSDIEKFAVRHLLKPEISFVPPNDSLNFQLVGKKIMYQDWGNEQAERLDEHVLAGRIILVAHTESFTHKTELLLETEVKVPSYEYDIPF